MAKLALLAAFTTSLLALRVRAECYSYGVDFQDGGTYFQNASSVDPFTFVQYFEGCNPDEASNIFVDPNGNEYQCSDTPLTPDDTDQQSTCPIDKDQLFSGDWSIIIASNNGNGDPIAYERDFSLIVGIPSTVTYTPTIYWSTTATPTFTQTSIIQTILPTTITKSVTKPAVTITPGTITITPSTVTQSSTVASTITTTTWDMEPVVTKVTHTKTCSIPPSQTTPDKTAHISPTLIHIKAKLLGLVGIGLGLRSEPTAAPVVGDSTAIDLDSLRANREAFVVERRERLAKAAALQRRGLDEATTTVTVEQKSDFVTSVSTLLGSATVTVTTTVIATSTSSVVTFSTIYNGTTTLPRKTITAPTPTYALTTYVISTTTSTLTVSPLVTIIVEKAPKASKKACAKAGGKLVPT